MYIIKIFLLLCTMSSMSIAMEQPPSNKKPRITSKRNLHACEACRMNKKKCNVEIDSATNKVLKPCTRCQLIDMECIISNHKKRGRKKTKNQQYQNVYNITDLSCTDESSQPNKKQRLANPASQDNVVNSKPNNYPVIYLSNNCPTNYNTNNYPIDNPYTNYLPSNNQYNYQQNNYPPINNYPIDNPYTNYLPSNNQYNYQQNNYPTEYISNNCPDAYTTNNYFNCINYNQCVFNINITNTQPQNNQPCTVNAHNPQQDVPSELPANNQNQDSQFAIDNCDQWYFLEQDGWYFLEQDGWCFHEQDPNKDLK